MNIITQVKKEIEEKELLRHGDRLCIGVSGGSDSVALLHLLNCVKYDLGFEISVAHYNHKLRSAADADQKFVERLAEKLNLSCYCGQWKGRRPSSGSLEEKARNQRFRFFCALAKAKNFNKIVLAHTRDDLAETVLMRLLRGSGLKGIRSILPTRMIDDCCFVRPLLSISKKELSRYLKKNKISFREDATNKDKKYSRNRVRHELLPLLKRNYNRNAPEVLAHFAENAAVDYSFLESYAFAQLQKYAQNINKGRTIKFDIKSFNKQHLAARRMMLRLSIERLKGSTNRYTLKHIKSIEELLVKSKAPAMLKLPGKITVNTDKHFLSLTVSNT